MSSGIGIHFKGIVLIADRLSKFLENSVDDTWIRIQEQCRQKKKLSKACVKEEKSVSVSGKNGGIISKARKSVKMKASERFPLPAECVLGSGHRCSCEYCRGEHHRQYIVTNPAHTGDLGNSHNVLFVHSKDAFMILSDPHWHHDIAVLVLVAFGRTELARRLRIFEF